VPGLGLYRLASASAPVAFWNNAVSSGQQGELGVQVIEHPVAFFGADEQADPCQPIHLALHSPDRLTVSRPISRW